MKEYKSRITGRVEEWWKSVCQKHDCKYYIHEDYPSCSYCTCPGNCIALDMAIKAFDNPFKDPQNVDNADNLAQALKIVINSVYGYTTATLERVHTMSEEEFEAYLKDEDLVVVKREILNKALEQQPCEDCISRQAVKDMLTAEWTKYMPMELDINLSFVLDKISALPSVTPKSESE